VDFVGAPAVTRRVHRVGLICGHSASASETKPSRNAAMKIKRVLVPIFIIIALGVAVFWLTGTASAPINGLRRGMGILLAIKVNMKCPSL